MNDPLIVSASPHLQAGTSTKKLMVHVIIALMPALVMSILNFGLQALVLTIGVTGACVGTEYVCRRLMKRKQTIGDLSAVVTGLILSLSLPPGLPVWMGIVGAIAAIGLIKQAFGGLGFNFLNPANGARAMLMLSFPLAMSMYLQPGTLFGDSASQTSQAPLQEEAVSSGTQAWEARSSATPLSDLASGESHSGYRSLFWGPVAGPLGSVSPAALLLGGLYLILKRVISPLVPGVMMVTILVMALLLGADPVGHLLSGGVMMAAFFMATDPVSSPLTGRGRLLFAMGTGILALLIRLYGDFPDGVSFALILMNILVPYLDRLTGPKPNKAGGAK